MPDDAVAAHKGGIADALAAGYALLEKGASAIDAGKPLCVDGR
jgi:beta-aspartyl-peptidase (threonine type)